MKSKSLKATFSLHDATLKALDAAVRGGAAPSKNAFVEEGDNSTTLELPEVNAHPARRSGHVRDRPLVRRNCWIQFESRFRGDVASHGRAR